MALINPLYTKFGGQIFNCVLAGRKTMANISNDHFYYLSTCCFSKLKIGTFVIYQHNFLLRTKYDKYEDILDFINDSNILCTRFYKHNGYLTIFKNGS